ncbi:sigma-70 family RNA polymerase sigma factor [soil metagenome]
MGAVQLDADAQLLARLRIGDETAFTELVRRYHSRLVALAGTFVGRRDLAEDVVQETWLAVLGGLDRFEGRAALRTWLFQICANRARSVAEREHRMIPVEQVDTDQRPDVFADPFAADGSWATPPRRWSGSIESDVDDSGLVAAVRVAIAGLPAGMRQVVTLRDVDGLSAQEVCAVLALSATNQRVLLHRGRARVRAALERAVQR